MRIKAKYHKFVVNVGTHLSKEEAARRVKQYLQQHVAPGADFVSARVKILRGTKP